MWDNPLTYLMVLGAAGALVTAGIQGWQRQLGQGAFREFMVELQDDIKKS